MTDWDNVRKQFRVTDNQVYLMNAGGGALSDEVLEAIIGGYKNVARYGGNQFGVNFECMEACRRELAELINAKPEEIAFVPSVSFAMNAIVHSCQSINKVVSLQSEFPSNILPWQNLQYPVDQLALCEDIEQKLLSTLSDVTEDVALVLSSVGYAEGYRLDLDRLSPITEKSTFILNTSQSMGVFPVDVQQSNVDALVCTPYKWMLGGEGCAFMYINPKFFKKLKPALIGWRSVKSALSFNNEVQFYDDARVFELGWDNMTVFNGFKRALEQIKEVGIQEIGERISFLANHLRRALEQHNIPTVGPVNTGLISGIVTIGPLKNVGAAFEYLSSKNILLNPRGDGLRASIHMYNNIEDIDKLVEELSHFLNQ